MQREPSSVGLGVSPGDLATSMLKSQEPKKTWAG